MKYTGSKGGSGILQFLSNNTPFHKRHFELFAGSGKYYFAKKAAEFSFLTDKNPVSIKYLIENSLANTNIVRCDAIKFMKTFEFEKRDFIYLDPPYPAQARKSKGKLYDYELVKDADHVKLLSSALAVNCNVMISTRENDLYRDMLSGWRMKKFLTCDRGGPVYELIYMNYDEPELLHQYNFLGKDNIDRQRISRKVEKMKSKMSNLPKYEKHALIQNMVKADADIVKHFLSSLQ